VKPLAQQRCYNHSDRVAAACCLKCGQFYCRECVTEHEGRLLCARCLGQVAKTPRTARFVLGGLLKTTACGVSFLLLWLFFYLVGRGLLTLPSSFHEGTLWQVDSSQNEKEEWRVPEDE